MAKGFGGRGGGATDPEGRATVPPAGAVEDILGRAKNLGGWLVVSFITPVPPGAAAASGGAKLPKPLPELGDQAAQRDAEDLRALRQLVEAQTEAIQELRAQLDRLRGPNETHGAAAAN